jgi:hypothetical protein
VVSSADLAAGQKDELQTASKLRVGDLKGKIEVAMRAAQARN